MEFKEKISEYTIIHHGEIITLALGYEFGKKEK